MLRVRLALADPYDPAAGEGEHPRIRVTRWPLVAAADHRFPAGGDIEGDDRRTAWSEDSARVDDAMAVEGDARNLAGGMDHDPRSAAGSGSRSRDSDREEDRCQDERQDLPAYRARDCADGRSLAAPRNTHVTPRGSTKGV